ncbi:mycofactocin-coupled SDR family oxidoreductase [Streptomyces flaveolus]|uniref:mycofactocin-coupled SDR family oxidoreductase n=1 Tax=Streptomyces flaveolus TaxID=67297 RepID=UPI00380EC627
MGRVEGKVALVTGAARGQGRSHAVRLAQEGADIIAVDITAQIDTVPYDMSTPADLAETVAQVEATGRRIVAGRVDVRDLAALTAEVNRAVNELGGLDIVVANAGISPLGKQPAAVFLDVVQVNLNGVVNTLSAAVPHLTAGGSVIVTGSVAGLRLGRAESDQSTTGPGGAGYGFAKRTVSSLVHSLARELGREGIRVNAVHPTNTATPMLLNEMMYAVFTGGAPQSTLADAEPAMRGMHVLDAAMVQPEDISAAVLFLASDEARMVTGQQLKVDAGCLALEPYSGV